MLRTMHEQYQLCKKRGECKDEEEEEEEGVGVHTPLTPYDVDSETAEDDFTQVGRKREIFSSPLIVARWNSEKCSGWMVVVYCVSGNSGNILKLAMRVILRRGTMSNRLEGLSELSS
tara:strand:+ start:119 stop:469 length:351 start_codon:yes stop_codon:yes gene_type:complete